MSILQKKGWKKKKKEGLWQRALYLTIALSSPTLQLLISSQLHTHSDFYLLLEHSDFLSLSLMCQMDVD